MQLSNDTLQVHIETQTFSAVASISFDDVFSATYTNYKVFFTGYGSTEAGMFGRLRVGGSDASGSDYNRQLVEANLTTIQTSRATNQTSWPFGQVDATSTIQTGQEVTFYNPFNTVNTAVIHDSVEISGGADALRVYKYSLMHKQNLSYDGFTYFITGGATITGKISVYGLAE